MVNENQCIVPNSPNEVAPEEACPLCDGTGSTGNISMHSLEQREDLDAASFRWWSFSEGAGPWFPMNESSGTEYDINSLKVRPDMVAELYERWVMPLTKEVEVAYLLNRLDHPL